MSCEEVAHALVHAVSRLFSTLWWGMGNRAQTGLRRLKGGGSQDWLPHGLWRALLLLVVPAVFAQNVPHIAYVLPAGGRQGTTVQVQMGGQFLPNVSMAYVSGRGVEVTVGEFARPMNGMQAAELRDRMQELQKQPASPAVQDEMVDIRAKLLLFNHTRLISPVLAETRTLRIAISPNAEPGRRELRVSSPQGLSNPIVFCVGQLPEVQEKETTEIVRPAANQPVNQVRLIQPPTNMAIALPVIVNGRIKPRIGTLQQQARQVQPFTPGETDRYRFQAHAGQSLVIAASARDLIPYLADAVPGWFQAVLTLYDAEGKEVAYDDDYRFHPDPVIHYVVPRDGEYTVEIKDAIYRGREDFVYRLTMGELPFVTDVFPLGGRAGVKTSVALAGWNLPATRATMDLKRNGPGMYTTAGARPFQADTLPEVLEKEPNDTAAHAQRVKLPIIVNGRVERPDDQDVFRFEGRAGEAIVAEVYARRLDSPLDSTLKLTDAAGRQLAFNDDEEDASAGLETHHADSRIMITLPANGAYYLYLNDAQHRGGPEYAYRLRISAPRPDFDLRVTPSAINTAGGMTVPVTVHAIRRDGFSGEIRLALKNAPKGMTISGAVLPAGQDQVRLTLSVPPQPQLQREPMSLQMEGRATIRGTEVARLALPAEDMMQAFFYWHLVPAQDLKVAIRRGNTFRAPVQVMAQLPLKIPAGGTVRFPVQAVLPANNLIDRLVYELSDPPAGVELRETTPVSNGAEIVLACDPAKAKAGENGNLIITISGVRKPTANGAPPANQQRIPLGSLPAVPFQIVPRE